VVGGFLWVASGKSCEDAPTLLSGNGWLSALHQLPVAFLKHLPDFLLCSLGCCCAALLIVIFEGEENVALVPNLIRPITPHNLLGRGIGLHVLAPEGPVRRRGK